MKERATETGGRGRPRLVPGDDAITVRQLLPLVASMRALGHDVTTLLDGTGVAPHTLMELQATANRSSTFAVWRRAEKVAGRDIGLAAVAIVDVRFAPMIAGEMEFLAFQLVWTSATIGEALARLALYYEAANGSARVELAKDERVARVRFVFPRRSETPPSFVEFTMLGLARILQRNASRPLDGLRIALAHRAPQSTSHAALIADVVTFDAPEDAFVLPVEELDIRLVTANPVLSARLLERAESLRVARAATRTLSDRVAERIEAALAVGDDPALAPIAQHLGLSVRHLTRRLRDEGTSHRELVERIRARLAHRAVAAGQPLHEVAVQLGYSDERALRRAFKRWFGAAPASFREGGERAARPVRGVRAAS